MSSNPHIEPFHGAHFGLLSLHDKASIIAPLLAECWQARLTNTTAFDTDSLGTFSGEVERRLSPLECALRKARLAVELTGADFGLGSEGSFGSVLWGLSVINQELVACVPARGDWFVVGCHAEPVAVSECQYGDSEAVARFWSDLPAGQGVMLIGEGRIAKAVTSRADADAQLAQWYGEQIPPQLRIAYDLRAHQSPLRRLNIARATTNLLARMDSRCSVCALPGFWPDQTETGLPCGDCGYPTNSARAQVAHCRGCGYRLSTPVTAVYADPATCPLCNP